LRAQEWINLLFDTEGKGSLPVENYDEQRVASLVKNIIDTAEHDFRYKRIVEFGNELADIIAGHTEANYYHVCAAIVERYETERVKRRGKDIQVASVKCWQIRGGHFASKTVLMTLMSGRRSIVSARGLLECETESEALTLFKNGTFIQPGEIHPVAVDDGIIPITGKHTFLPEPERPVREPWLEPLPHIKTLDENRICRGIVDGNEGWFFSELPYPEVTLRHFRDGARTDARLNLSGVHAKWAFGSTFVFQGDHGIKIGDDDTMPPGIVLLSWRAGAWTRTHIPKPDANLIDVTYWDGHLHALFIKRDLDEYSELVETRTLQRWKDGVWEVVVPDVRCWHKSRLLCSGKELLVQVRSYLTDVLLPKARQSLDGIECLTEVDGETVGLA